MISRITGPNILSWYRWNCTKKTIQIRVHDTKGMNNPERCRPGLDRCSGHPGEVEVDSREDEVDILGRCSGHRGKMKRVYWEDVPDCRGALHRVYR
jgi:hypothetical protein